jgi:aerobic carbon-monoxide dehydrogenase medium subunit
MIPQSFEYSAPANLSEALALLSDGRAKVLAGGMSLIPMMKLRLATPEQIVDIGRLAELNYIRDEKGAIRVGAATPHQQIEVSALLRSKCPLIAETAACIGDPQVRNMGTIGGSAAHADPAADYPAALLALEAQFRLAGKSSERSVTAAEFFVDSFTTALRPGEIVREIVVPAEEPGTGVRYEKVAHPASGFAVVGVAVRVRKAGGKITLARIGLTGVTNRAFRATKAEGLLEGTSGTAEELRRAAATAAGGIEVNSDLYASSEYRRHLVKVYTARALAAAIKRAG